MEIRKNLAFTREEYLGRVDRVRGRMKERGIDALLLHTPENICYLTGFQTSGYYFVQALIVPADKDPIFVVRALEKQNVDAWSWLADDQVIIEYLRAALGEPAAEAVSRDAKIPGHWQTRPCRPNTASQPQQQRRAGGSVRERHAPRRLALPEPAAATARRAPPPSPAIPRTTRGWRYGNRC